MRLTTHPPIGTGKRQVNGRLGEQSWTDKATGEQRSRAEIAASQVLLLDDGRTRTGLPTEPANDEIAQPETEQLSQPKRSRRKQAA